MNWRIIFIGFLFAVLWGSASTATKFGLQSAQPFVIAITRFAIAGSMMLVLTHGILKNRMPEKKEWNQIIIFGLLNISIYLGLYVIAMQYISAGLGSLFLAVNPVMISFISTALFGHKVTYTNVISLMLCISGVIIAAIPLMEHSYASPKGLLIMTASMMTYSLGTIYFTNKKWNNLYYQRMANNYRRSLYVSSFIVNIQYKQEYFRYKFLGSHYMACNTGINWCSAELVITFK